jgi:capsule polysaccharide export protein KpsE/RkpR
MLSLLSIMLRYKWVILLFTLVGFAVSSIVSMLLPPRYVSSAMFIPLGVAQDISGQRGFFAPLGAFGESFSMYLRARKNYMIDSIIRSGRMGNIIVRRFDLQHVYRVKNNREAGKRLRRNTRVIIRDEGAIMLSVEDRDASRASAIAAAYISVLDSILIDLGAKSLRESITYLDADIARAEDEIAHSDSLLASYFNEHGVYNMQQQLSAMLDIVSGLSARLSVLDVEKKLLKTMMKSSSPELERVQFEWNELRQQLFLLRETGAEPGLFPSFKRLPEITLGIANITSKRRVQEFVINYLRLKLADTKRVANSRVSALRIIDPPAAPQERAWPKRKQIVLISTAASLFWSAFFLLVREQLRNGNLTLDAGSTFPSARDVEGG